MGGGGMARESGVWAWSVVLFLFGIAWSDAAVAGITGVYGSWRYLREGDGEDLDSFFQNYNVDFAQELNEATGLNGAVRYSRNSSQGRVSEIVSPNAGVYLRNDIFRVDLSGLVNWQKNSEGPDLVDRSWEAAWSSAWQRRWWPTLRANYGQSFVSDDETPRTQDIDSSHGGLTVDWDLSLARAYYSYFRQESTDNVTGGEENGENHLARLEAARTFWGDRLSVSLSEQYTLNNQESLVPPGTGGVSLHRGFLSQVSSGVDDTPEEGSLAANPGLVDGNRDEDALVIDPLELDPVNIGLRVNFQQVDWIYLYIAEDPGLDANDVAQFRWDLYTSSDGIRWTRGPRDLAASYNPQFRRLQVETRTAGVQSSYLKLVAVQKPISRVAFTEVEFYYAGSQTEERDYTDYLTDVNLGVRLTTDTYFAYGLTYEKGIFDPGPDFDRQAQSGTFRWSPSVYFVPSLSASETREQTTDRPETMNRSYAFNVASSPLQTLDFNLGATRSLGFEGGERLSTTDNYSLLTTAALFPDLDSNLDIFYTSMENEVEADTQPGTSRSLGTRLVLTARLNPSLTTDLTGNYTKSLAGTDTGSRGVGLGVSWRPSDILYLRASGSQDWVDLGEDSTSLLLSLGLAPTNKTQVSMTYGYFLTTSRSENFGVFWTWAISPVFSVQMDANYRILEDEEPWGVGAQLTASFSGL